MTARFLPLLVLPALLLAGCGGGSKGAAGLPDCAGAGQSVALPADFPKEFPLPSSTIVTSVERQRAEGRDFVVIDSRVAAGLRDTADFFERELPDAGYRLGEGDAEADEAETSFTGNGSFGRLKVRTLEGCEEAVTLEVAVTPSAAS